MTIDPVERLSSGQRECLRLVYRHMETKEIARILGISPGGVTQRIKAAMRILGVNRRRDAASLLASLEATESTPLIYPTLDIASGAFREERAPGLAANELPTKVVRAPDGEFVELKVVNSDSQRLPYDLLAAFRSNVRNILKSRDRSFGESGDPPKA